MLEMLHNLTFLFRVFSATIPKLFSRPSHLIPPELILWEVLPWNVLLNLLFVATSGLSNANLVISAERFAHIWSEPVKMLNPFIELTSGNTRLSVISFPSLELQHERWLHCGKSNMCWRIVGISMTFRQHSHSSLAHWLRSLSCTILFLKVGADFRFPNVFSAISVLRTFVDFRRQSRPLCNCRCSLRQPMHWTSVGARLGHSPCSGAVQKRKVSWG